MTGYERLPKGKDYYIDDVADSGGSAVLLEEDKDAVDEHNYETANYYSSKEVAENNLRADRLMRQLRRYAVERNEGEIDWGNINQSKFFIVYDFDSEEIFVSWVTCTRDFGQIYFTSEQIAEQAIEEFKDELLWYFTEYQDHIVNADKKVECDCCGNAEKLKAMATLEFEFCPKCGNKLGGAE